MVILGICRDLLPKRVVDTFSWVSGTCVSIGSAICNLRQKTHNVFRSVLLRSLDWLENPEQKSPMMREVEVLSEKSYKVFGSHTTESTELACMIAALRAQAILKRETEKECEVTTTKSTFSRIHDTALSILGWLEKGQVSLPMEETIKKVEETITMMWRQQTVEYASLQIGLSSTSSEAKKTALAEQPTPEEQPQQ